MVRFVTDHFNDGRMKYEGKYIFSCIMLPKNKNENLKYYDIVAQVKFTFQFGGSCASWNQEELEVGRVWVRRKEEGVDCKVKEIEITDCFTNKDIKYNFINNNLQLDVCDPVDIINFVNDIDLDEASYNAIITKVKELFEEEL